MEKDRKELLIVSAVILAVVIVIAAIVYVVGLNPGKNGDREPTVEAIAIEKANDGASAEEVAEVVANTAEAAADDDEAEDEDPESWIDAIPEGTIPLDAFTLDGNLIDGSFYAKNDITIVNMMATSCPYCIHEMEDLDAINTEDNGVGVISVIADTVNWNYGRLDARIMADAIGIRDKLELEYPLLVPSPEIMVTTLGNMAPIFPLSFIVDKDGRKVGEPIVGMQTRKQWDSIIAQAKGMLADD